MLARAASIRLASKTPAAPRVAVPTVSRTTVRMSASGPTKDDVAALKEAAFSAAQKAAGAAKEAIKDLDVDKVKGAVSGGVAGIKGAIDAALSLWSKFDTDGDGKLTIEETLTLLNSKELTDAIQSATGLAHTKRTEKDIEAWFYRADFDKSETLSKREFTVMYAGLLAEKAKGGIKGMASAVCTALDTDSDGTIGAPELKAILQNTPLASLAGMLPDGAVVNYRDFLGKA